MGGSGTGADPVVGQTPGTPGAPPFSAPKSGARRLSRDEYDNTVRDLLGDNTRAGKRYLPLDVFTPFDNDFTAQETSPGLIEGVELLADEAAARLVGDVAARTRLLGCKPAGPDDAVCLRKFVTTFGRRVLRRPLRTEEIDAFMRLQTHAAAAGDFYVGMSLVVRALLQDPEFLYRIEFGTPQADRPGVFKLNSFEVASRLSYFFWGTAPDDLLLDAAAANKLTTVAEMRAAATRLLGDPRAVARVKRFHAMWLGYHQLPEATGIDLAMRAESDALVERVVFTDKRSWLDVFRAEETFVDDALAAHYALPVSGSKGSRWVPYGGNQRRGILSHGSFLSLGAKGDTSPTQRGLLIRQRLACQDIPPPPPNLETDEPPKGAPGSCKADRYRQHAESASCRGCHMLIDPVGFGLENYDTSGRFRTTDTDNPACAISGKGELTGVGTFSGPAELGALLAQSGVMESCLVKRVYSLAMGAPDADAEAPLVDYLTAKLRSNGARLDELLVEMASSSAFAYRQQD